MKRKRLFRRLLLSGVLLCILSLSGWTQQDSFAYSARLDTVRQAGFFKVMLMPGVVAKCKEDLSDVRIRDQQGRDVPYVLQNDLPVLASSGFSEFPILSSQQDSITNVEISNLSSSPVHSLLLYIRNIGVRRSFTLSGSDDRHQWYIIKEHIVLEPASGDSVEYYIQPFDFPASNYKYFKIGQEGKGLPVKIVRVGIATQHVTNGKYFAVPDPVIARKDSGHHSYISLSYGESYLVDRLDLSISGPLLYKRQARLYDKDAPYAGMDIVIDPVHHSFQLPSIKARILMMDINNEDNAPLVIDKAATSQLERYLLAYLQPGMAYQLLAGNTKAMAPAYDLKYFVDSVTQAMEIVPGHLDVVSRPGGRPAEPARDQSSIFLWSVIVLVLALLIFLSIKMLKAIPHGSQKEDTK